MQKYSQYLFFVCIHFGNQSFNEIRIFDDMLNDFIIFNGADVRDCPSRFSSNRVFHMIQTFDERWKKSLRLEYLLYIHTLH